MRGETGARCDRTPHEGHGVVYAQRLAPQALRAGCARREVVRKVEPHWRGRKGVWSLLRFSSAHLARKRSSFRMAIPAERARRQSVRRARCRRHKSSTRKRAPNSAPLRNRRTETSRLNRAIADGCRQQLFWSHAAVRQHWSGTANSTSGNTTAATALLYLNSRRNRRTGTRP